MVLWTLLVLAKASPRPDYGIQPGDDGTYQGDNDHHHHDHHHDHDQPQDLPQPPPPPAPIAAKPQKTCRLERELVRKGPMCTNEPECEEKCQDVPQEKCSVVNEKQCQTVNNKVCNTVNEEVCETNYITQYENQCTNTVDKKCETK